ncbi:putative crustin-like antimicrobial peptide 17 [Homarus americanus]|uniref:Putative crustin-like antimicrobial peptide 17 n=1 Tax=Homarus americanus TaxID=6706 RepID=A0A8J5N454_HOMAM|nr:putative crustin-like antimicrobial peptide 17 [Homarus americanus]
MKVVCVAVMTLVVAVSSIPQFQAPASCRYWCKTPENRVFCCEDERTAPDPVITKIGGCPPVRDVCPPVRVFTGPQTCAHDGNCPGDDKCCFDRCLEETVCKPPNYGIIGTGFPLSG